MINLKTHFKSSTALTLARNAKSLVKNNDGIAAIEFALLAPVMIFMYLGLAEISDAIQVDRNISHAANVAGDLATQSAELSETDIENYLTATLLVMNVPNLEKTSIELYSYRYDAAAPKKYVEIGNAVMKDGTAPVSGVGGFAYDPDAAGLIPSLLNDTSGVVVARVNYEYQPVGNNYMKPVMLHETFVLKPRKSTSVAFEDGEGTSYTCSISTTDVDGSDIPWKVNCA